MGNGRLIAAALVVVTRVLLPVGVVIGLVPAMDRAAAAQQSDAMKAQTRPLTASVLGTFLIRGNEIELLVLWRDAPGWLFSSERLRSSRSASTYSVSIEYGSVQLDLAYDRARRVARINGKEVALPQPNNIVMVDEVSSGRPVAKVAAADLSLSGNPEVASLLKRSPEVVAFLKCDAVTAHPLQARIDSLVCDDLTP